MTNSKASHQPLGKKLIKQLLWIRQCTDKPTGMYAGERFDMAPAQFRKLISHGLAMEQQPHNPSHHYPYVVITEKGRDLLEALKETV